MWNKFSNKLPKIKHQKFSDESSTGGEVRQGGGSGIAILSQPADLVPTEKCIAILAFEKILYNVLRFKKNHIKK